jgi:hypothetical protein
MNKLSKDLTPIGITNYRNTNKVFGIKDLDRMRHLYLVGKSGTGKSTLIKNMVMSDIRRGNGLCLIDPHGDMVSSIVQQIPNERMGDLIYFNPRDLKQQFAFNPLSRVPPKYHHIVASNLVATFRKVWSDSWGVRLEYILRYCLLTLLWFPEATLLDIQLLLTNKEFRHRVLEYVQDKHVISFWENEFDNYTPRLRAEAIAPVLNKTGVLTASLPLRSVFGNCSKTLRMREMMDTGKIFLVNLSKGDIGEDAASLLGSILISVIQQAAVTRASIAEHKRRPYYLYIDECHSFLTKAVIDILSESRKYALSLCLANQYITQLDDKIREGIFGNVGTLITFTVGADDAAFLSKEFDPTFQAEDLVNLPKYSIYIKLMIDAEISKPFSATTMFSV